MAAFVREFLPHRFLPESPAVLPAHRQHDELVMLGHRDVIVRARSMIVDWGHRLAVGNWNGQENPVTHHNGSGMALARKGDLPSDVLSLAPVQRRVSARRHAIGKRASPLWPG